MILSSAVDLISEIIGFVADILNQAGVPVSSKYNEQKIRRVQPSLFLFAGEKPPAEEE